MGTGGLRVGADGEEKRMKGKGERMEEEEEEAAMDQNRMVRRNHK